MAEIPVKVEVSRSGGFAGIALHSEVDVATLSPSEVDELTGLIAQANLDELVPRLSAAPAAPTGPDRFLYDVTVRTGQNTYQFAVQEGAVPPEVQPLLALVMRRGRRRL